MKTFLCSVILVSFAKVTSAATFSGTFWDADVFFRTVDEAIAFAETNPSTARFESSLIDYPRVGTINPARTTSLTDLLGPDAGSLMGADAPRLDPSVFLWTGEIALAAGVHDFAVSSDDGFRLSIEGLAAFEWNNTRSFGTT
ncbi:MAG: hypothetical protein AAGF71_15125, partial [Pseudomonadota bacterium]